MVKVYFKFANQNEKQHKIHFYYNEVWSSKNKD